MLKEVVLVMDNPESLGRVRGILQAASYRVMAVGDWMELTEAMRSDPKLFIVDDVLPETLRSGRFLAARLVLSQKKVIWVGDAPNMPGAVHIPESEWTPERFVAAIEMFREEIRNEETTYHT